MQPNLVKTLPEWAHENTNSSIDWPFFYQATMGNKTLAAEIVILFYNQVSIYAEQLTAMNNDIHHPDCKLVAHALRSAAGAIGARDLLQQARALELCEIDTIAPVLATFKRTVDDLTVFFSI